MSGPFIRRSTAKVSVGVDFGTHSTKVAFFELGVGARAVRPLRFHHDLSDWADFTLPSLGVIRNGALLWGAAAATALQNKRWNEGIRRLKVLLTAVGDMEFADQRLLEDYRRELESARVDAKVWSPQHVAAAALAIQIQTILTQLREQFRDRQIDARFTIPVPIDHIQDSTVLGIYRRVTRTAEQLLKDDGSLRFKPDELVDAAAQEFAQATAIESGDSLIYTLPEAVAQIASYLTSLEATSGVHGVIDIGAGTTDFCVFLLERPERNVQICFWYSALAVPKAASLAQRLVAIEFNRDHPGEPLGEGGMIKACAQHPAAVGRALEQIRLAGHRAWVEGYRHLMQETQWHGCPIFLCGGGALLPGARKEFHKCWMPQWPLHAVRDLPLPHEYKGDNVPFSRMSVAYGLSIPGPEHGHFILPKDSPNHTPPKRYRRYEGMGGDQLYPTPDWL